MTARFIAPIITGFTLALLSQPAAAWGPLGHRAIGAVADALLTPVARAQVARLLADDLGRDGQPSGRTTLAEVSIWADEIRGSDADRPKWHYDNMPVCRPAAGERAWCERQQCASGRIEPLLQQLTDRGRTPKERREALKWIAHLVGDMHQPLHATDYAEGGNGVRVELEGRTGAGAWTLHAAWDVRLVSLALHAGAGQQPSPSALRSLIGRAGRLEPAVREAPPDRWLAESNRLAREVALDFPGFACDSAPAGPVVLTADYQRRAQRVIRSQLALAGARLATVLNRALQGG